MKTLKKVLFVLLGLLVLLGIFCYFFINSLKPDYEGTKELSGLANEVIVYFDAYGIPHIYGETEIDAFKALGYVHAQDRLWQMELLRRVAKGRLSQVFGKDLIETDKFLLTLGIDEHTNRTIPNLDKNSEMVKLSQAYLDGINEFISNGPTPVEFYLTGIDKAPFTLEDIYNATGYMSFSFAMAQKTDPLLTSINEKLGLEYIKELAIDSDSSTVWIKNYKSKGKDTTPVVLSSSVHTALGKLPIPQFIGSNSWVIAPEKTKNGKVIFANDPHIGFSQPSVWYEAHVTTPNYEKYGYHLAGVPFPLLGHDRNLAYGLTMFENDDIDFYYEETNPKDSTQYKTEAGWKSYKYITKTIEVKDEPDIPFTYKVTRHGSVLPTVSQQMVTETPISMSWIYTQIDNKVMDAFYEMSHAKNIEGFAAALPKIHAPGLNVMYGDAKGNVAWWASAKLYQMPDSSSTKFILDGVNGQQERLEYLDFSENPSAINPPWNYVYSANNQPDSIAGKLYPGYYLPENRAKRITNLLDVKDDWDKPAVSKMIVDVTSSINPSLVTEMLKSLEVENLSEEQLFELDALKNWKGNYPLESTSATLFHRCEYFVLKNMYQDEMGVELFTQFLATHVLKRQIASGIKNENSIWWDNIATKNIKETRGGIVLSSFKEAWDSLVADFGSDPKDWTWGKVHTIEHEHPIGQLESLKSFFNVGPYPVNGSREVINNMAFPYDSTGYYKVNSGPSTRRVIDFSDIENSISILPTGQSGNPLSKHYEDQAEMYVNGEFRKMMLNEKEIKESAEDILILKPKNK